LGQRTSAHSEDCKQTNISVTGEISKVLIKSEQNQSKQEIYVSSAKCSYFSSIQDKAEEMLN
jgi:hypothetical protein